MRGLSGCRELDKERGREEALKIPKKGFDEWNNGSTRLRSKKSLELSTSCSHKVGKIYRTSMRKSNIVLLKFV